MRAAVLFGAVCAGGNAGQMSPALAQATVDALSITAAWTRATPPGARSAGGYLTIDNPGSEADRLVGASSPLAARVEIHQMRMQGGTMTMRPAADGVALPPRSSLTFAPGGLHLMLMGLTQSLTEGTSVPVTLTLQNSGEIEVRLAVLGLGARGPVRASATDGTEAGSGR